MKGIYLSLMIIRDYKVYRNPVYKNHKSQSLLIDDLSGTWYLEKLSTFKVVSKPACCLMNSSFKNKIKYKNKNKNKKRYRYRYRDIFDGKQLVRRGVRKGCRICICR